MSDMYYKILIRKHLTTVLKTKFRATYRHAHKQVPNVSHAKNFANLYRQLSINKQKSIAMLRCIQTKNQLNAITNH